MSRCQSMAGLTALGVVGLCLALFSSDPNPAEELAEVASPNARTRSESGGLSSPLWREIQALRLELSALQATQAELAARIEEIGAREEGEEDEGASEALEDEPAPGVQRLEALNEALERDGVDPAWSVRTEREIAVRLQRADLAGARFVDAICGATLCRVEIELPPSGDTDGTTRALHDVGPWGGASFVVVEQGDPAVAEIWVAREGHPLPRPG